MALRSGEMHPPKHCALVQAASDLLEGARSAPEGRLVTEDTFWRLCLALDALHAPMVEDTRSEQVGGLDLSRGPWQRIADRPV